MTEGSVLDRSLTARPTVSRKLPGEELAENPALHPPSLCAGHLDIYYQCEPQSRIQLSRASYRFDDSWPAH
jgi:hypothetical protein